MTRWEDWEPLATGVGGRLLVKTGTDAEGHDLGIILVPGVPPHPPMLIASMLAMFNGYGDWVTLPGVALPRPLAAPPKPRWPTRQRRRRGP